MIIRIVYISEIKYMSLGCWKDVRQNSAIPTLENSTPILDGYHQERRRPVLKCAKAASFYEYDTFAIQDSGYCSSSKNASKSYSKYGESSHCATNGQGGTNLNEVYKLIDGKIGIFILRAIIH